MVQSVPYDQYLKEVNHSLINGGIFLTTQDAEKRNTMVIGWGGINFFWGMPIFLVPVRRTRYTYPLLENTGFFTVSIPLERDMKKALVICGTKSGKDLDKFETCGLTAMDGRSVPVPIIGECALHYECKVVYSQEMNPETLCPDINDKFYPNYHTMFYGQILESYVTEE